MQLLKSLIKVVDGKKNADLICYTLTSLVSLQHGNVKKSEKLMKIDIIEKDSLQIYLMS